MSRFTFPTTTLCKPSWENVTPYHRGMIQKFFTAENSTCPFHRKFVIATQLYSSIVSIMLYVHVFSCWSFCMNCRDIDNNYVTNLTNDMLPAAQLFYL